MSTVSLLENKYSTATILNAICIKTFGLEYLNWEPETVKSELEIFSKEIPDINLDKIQAISTLMTTEQYYRYYEAFECISNTFNNNAPNFDIATPLNPMEVTWSIVEASLNDIEEFEDKEAFYPEVSAYINTVFLYYGLVKVPSVLKNIVTIEYKAPDWFSKEQINESLLYDKDITHYVNTRLDQLKKEIREQD